MGSPVALVAPLAVLAAVLGPKPSEPGCFVPPALLHMPAIR
jgi:hypothetical protein